ncbi:MAG: hypothetical protein A2X94_08845 [Bdellovibrionales bacterium GWB1_55_8]|nr:MAG: hypothetical protein A2X94_08845 [Bdellovibrionales bacterium GWB1_55_8]
MKIAFFSLSAVMLLGCSPGNGDMQWTLLQSEPAKQDAPVPIDTSIPSASGIALGAVQVSGGSGRLQGAGLNARITIGLLPESEGPGLKVRNLLVKWEN